jgi:type IV pilus assembly protein PilF
MRYLGLLMLLLLITSCATTQTNSQADEKELAKIYLDMGLVYLRRGELALAQERLEKSLSIRPKDPDALHYIAEVYNRLGKIPEAEKNYRKALELKPQDPNLLNNFAAFLCSQTHYDEAERIFLKVASNPAYTTPYLAYENAGRCVLRQGKKEKAEGYFVKALRAQPKLPNSLFHMAELQFDQENHFKARAYLERYLEVGGKSPDVLLLGYQIEKSLGDDQMAAKYANQLITEYRDAEQTERLRALEHDASRAQSLKE